MMAVVKYTKDDIKPGMIVHARVQDGHPFAMRCRVRRVCANIPTILCSAMVRLWPHRIGDILQLCAADIERIEGKD